MRVEIDLDRAWEWYAGLNVDQKIGVVMAAIWAVSLIAVRVAWWRREEEWFGNDPANAMVAVFLGPLVPVFFLVWVATWVATLGMCPPPWKTLRS